MVELDCQLSARLGVVAAETETLRSKVNVLNQRLPGILRLLRGEHLAGAEPYARILGLGVKKHRQTLVGGVIVAAVVTRNRERQVRLRFNGNGLLINRSRHRHNRCRGNRNRCRYRLIFNILGCRGRFGLVFSRRLGLILSAPGCFGLFLCGNRLVNSGIIGNGFGLRLCNLGFWLRLGNFLFYRLRRCENDLMAASCAENKFSACLTGNRVAAPGTVNSDIIHINTSKLRLRPEELQERAVSHIYVGF